MSKQVGTVVMYRLVACPKGCNPLAEPTEECVRHTKEETDAMLKQLRADLTKGDYITFTTGQETLSLQTNDVASTESEGRITLNGDAMSLHVVNFSPTLSRKSEYDVPLIDVLSIEIDSIIVWNLNHIQIPLVYWRHGTLSYASSRFFRCDYPGAEGGS